MLVTNFSAIMCLYFGTEVNQSPILLGRQPSGEEDSLLAKTMNNERSVTSDTQTRDSAKINESFSQPFKYLRKQVFPADDVITFVIFFIKYNQAVFSASFFEHIVQIY